MSTPPCLSSEGTIIRRARPTLGCSCSPLPQISLLVSTTTTLRSMSDSSRATSRTMVVLPLPGDPRIRIELRRGMEVRVSGGAVMEKKNSECPIRPTMAVGGWPMAVGV